MTTLQVNSTHKTRDLNMQNYSALTSHQVAPKAPKKHTHAVPKVGDIFKLEANLVTQEEGATPMAKIRYSAQDRSWAMVNKVHAGMYVFFNSDPQAHHTQFRVTSIIPSGTGCYADPIE